MLIAVAHGSRDPRSAATMYSVVERIAAARPDLDVRLAFLDLSTPSVDLVVDAVAAEGHSHAIVVPLLLGSAFHARRDLPGLLAAARQRHPRLTLTQSDVLGPDPRLLLALRDRVIEQLTDAPVDRPRIGSGAQASALRPEPAEYPAGAMNRPAALATRSAGSNDPHALPERIGIAVAAVGSSSAAANEQTARIADRLGTLTGRPTEICFATTEPTVTEAIARLHARGADRILLAPWFLAPGLLTDRLLTAAPDVVHADTIGAHPLLAEVVLARYAAAATLPLELSA